MVLPSPAVHPQPGLVVGGDYRLVAPLREGGMGAVWIAEQLSVGRRRALKVMRADLSADPRFRERFAREATIGSRIESEHVVEMIAAGVDEETAIPWIAMELLEGSDLADAIARRGPLPAAEVFDITEQLGHALAAAHAAGVVHRDLKPENVFLARPRRAAGGSFDVKVRDFGLAGRVAEARVTSSSFVAGGTPLYAAPEQTDVATVPSPALDVWALGLLVYRALTARYFWCAANVTPVSAAALLREILFGELSPPSMRAAEHGLAGRLPAGFDDWFGRCLRRDPLKRFRDAGEPLARRLPRRRPRARSPLRRRRPRRRAGPPRWPRLRSSRRSCPTPTSARDVGPDSS